VLRASDISGVGLRVQVSGVERFRRQRCRVHGLGFGGQG
jgi:hypothetical protein